MKFRQAFLYSLKLPSKQAMFKLNRIGMDITVIYMFILLFIVSIPSLIDRITATSGMSSDMNILFLLLYFFIFYYLPLTIMVFLLLSIVAYISTGIAKLLKRKIRFSILWKLAAYVTTIPLLLYTVIAFLIPVSDTFLLLVTIYVFILMLKMITVYPKRKIRSK
ncbi:DUF1189 family protein [Oceanobacillus halotolerans]|uniref:DUF1189 family protein n=1 Tax=Oceanobacillus halotolerans TaxID=2663380 RepID=UPI0013D31AB9|nr:DUF1189 family protein [Oceanobacillus halotolerans]